jgi:uncharacterized protein (DUF736 family)
VTYEIKELSGSVFKNKRKEKDTHPDYQGSIKIEGVEYWLSGWKKQKQDGEAWISLAFKPKEAKQPVASPAETAAAARKTGAFADMPDDDINF